MWLLHRLRGTSPCDWLTLGVSQARKCVKACKAFRNLQEHHKVFELWEWLLHVARTGPPLEYIGTVGSREETHIYAGHRVCSLQKYARARSLSLWRSLLHVAPTAPPRKYILTLHRKLMLSEMLVANITFFVTLRSQITPYLKYWEPNITSL